jgi:hypothetical protein
MDDWLHTGLRGLHLGGAYLAFAAAPLALLAVKGSRRHIVAGSCFALGIGISAIAGLVLTFPPDIPLLSRALVVVFLAGTGYLAPRIGRGSRAGYRWDRALTAIGGIASVALVYDGLSRFTLATLTETDMILGIMGLSVAVAHSRWRGPADPAGWQVEHLTSLLAAYAVACMFIAWFYLLVVPSAARSPIPAVLGFAAILWARRRFREPRTGQQLSTGVRPELPN